MISFNTKNKSNQINKAWPTKGLSKKKSNLPRSIILYFFIPNILFIGWYFIIAFNNRFTIDDYWHGYKLYKYGLIDSLIYNYFHQEGSLSHVLLATTPHIFLTKQSYSWLFNCITFLSLWSSIYILIFRSLNYKSILLNLILSLLVLNTFFLSVTSKSEVLFCLWLNFSYTFGISLFLFGIACIDKYKKFAFF